MEKKEIFYLHELMAEVANSAVEGHPEIDSASRTDHPITSLDDAAADLFNLESYEQVETRPWDVMAAKRDHKHAAFELARAITDGLDDVPEMDIEASADSLNNNLYETSSLSAKEQQEFTASEWEISEAQTVKFTPHIRSKIPNIDKFTLNVAKDLLNMDARVLTGDETYRGRIRKFDSSLSTFEISDSGEITVVEEPELISLNNSDIVLRTVDLDELDPSPLAVKKFDRRSNQEYIQSVSENGGLPSLPIARPTEDGFEVMDGHKGVYIAGQAGLDNHIVYIEECSDFEAAEEFVKDHVPPYDVFQSGYGDDSFYNPENVSKVIEKVESMFGSRAQDMEIAGEYLEPEIEVPDVEDVIDRGMVEQTIRERADEVNGEKISDESIEALADLYYNRVEASMEEAFDYMERDVRQALGLPMDQNLDGSYEGVPDQLGVLLNREGFVSDI